MASVVESLTSTPGEALTHSPGEALSVDLGAVMIAGLGEELSSGLSVEGASTASTSMAAAPVVSPNAPVAMRSELRVKRHAPVPISEPVVVNAKEPVVIEESRMVASHAPTAVESQKLVARHQPRALRAVPGTEAARRRAARVAAKERAEAGEHVDPDGSYTQKAAFLCGSPVSFDDEPEDWYTVQYLKNLDIIWDMVWPSNQPRKLVRALREPISDLFGNPGMGFQTQPYDALPRFGPIDIPSQTAYTRFYWHELQPDGPGSVKWDLIDDAIQQACSLGRRLSFRVMPYLSRADCGTISYVKDRHPAGVDTRKFFHLPGWLIDDLTAQDGGEIVKFEFKNSDNEIYCTSMVFVPFPTRAYVKHVENLVAMMAARYNGHSHIDFIDVGFVGNTGEWSHDGTAQREGPLGWVQTGLYWSTTDLVNVGFGPNATEILQEIPRLFKEHFTKTPLILNCLSLAPYPPIHPLHGGVLSADWPDMLDRNYANSMFRDNFGWRYDAWGGGWPGTEHWADKMITTNYREAPDVPAITTRSRYILDMANHSPVALEVGYQIPDWYSLARKKRVRPWTWLLMSFARALAWRASYINLKGADNPWPDGATPGRRRKTLAFLRMVGYRLVLRQVSAPPTVARRLMASLHQRVLFKVSMRWENHGVARCFGSYRVSFRLRRNGEKIGHTCRTTMHPDIIPPADNPSAIWDWVKDPLGPDFPDPDPFRPDDWTPGQHVTELDIVFTFPHDMLTGQYILDVAITDESGRAVVRLAIDGEPIRGEWWYPVLPIEIV